MVDQVLLCTRAPSQPCDGCERTLGDWAYELASAIQKEPTMEVSCSKLHLTDRVCQSTDGCLKWARIVEGEVESMSKEELSLPAL
jgi:hypothetical protein